MKYCKKCVLPDVRPGITLNKYGICSGCIGHETKNNRINWSKRYKDLLKIFGKAKKKSTTYDCIVPFSGANYCWF